VKRISQPALLKRTLQRHGCLACTELATSDVRMGNVIVAARWIWFQWHDVKTIAAEAFREPGPIEPHKEGTKIDFFEDDRVSLNANGLVASVDQHVVEFRVKLVQLCDHVVHRRKRLGRL
jgi:hypothetical protein